MWSGQQFSTEWALNPSAYKNISHEDVDWAALAQQWIQMKESIPINSGPGAIAPPPSTVETKSDCCTKDKGEAPMDVENDENEPESSWGSWNNWQQWSWNWPGIPPNATSGTTTAPMANPDAGGSASSTHEKEGYGYTSFIDPSVPPTIDYNHGTVPDITENSLPFWSGSPDIPGAPLPKDGHTQRPLIRNTRYSWRRLDRERDKDKDRDRTRINTDIKSEEEEMVETLDAAKRKQLPAWIREGLEKMEREKQKKMDKERQKKEREEYLQKKREENTVNNIEKPEAGKCLSKVNLLVESEDLKKQMEKNVIKQRKSRFQNSESPEDVSLKPKIEKETSPIAEPMEKKSREELLEDIMLKVRRTLTHILLEVTTEEMTLVAHEVYQKALAKAPAMRLRKTQALASITGRSGLGLGIYGSDDSDSENNDQESVSSKKSECDSDAELQVQIQKRKENFMKTALEIESQLAEELERERISFEGQDSSEDEQGQVQNQDEKSKIKSEGHGKHESRGSGHSDCGEGRSKKRTFVEETEENRQKSLKVKINKDRKTLESFDSSGDKKVLEEGNVKKKHREKKNEIHSDESDRSNNSRFTKIRKTKKRTSRSSSRENERLRKDKKKSKKYSDRSSSESTDLYAKSSRNERAEESYDSDVSDGNKNKERGVSRSTERTYKNQSSDDDRSSARKRRSSQESESRDRRYRESRRCKESSYDNKRDRRYKESRYSRRHGDSYRSKSRSTSRHGSRRSKNRRGQRSKRSRSRSRYRSSRKKRSSSASSSGRYGNSSKGSSKNY